MEISNSREDIARVGEGHRQGWMSMVKTTSSHKEKRVTELECILFLEMSSMVAKALNCFLFLESAVSLSLAGEGNVVLWCG